MSKELLQEMSKFLCSLPFDLGDMKLNGKRTHLEYLIRKELEENA